VNDRPRTVRTPATEDATIATVEREPQEFPHDVARELGLSKPRVLEIPDDDQLHEYRYWHTCFYTIVL
jgi:hypothetical protein